LMSEDIKNFYDREYAFCGYATTTNLADHVYYPALQDFISKYGLSSGKHCLEVGCGRGAFQDLADDYTGVDLSDAVRDSLHKPFYQASAIELPFEDNTFDAVWTLAVLEHVPEVERAFSEIRRVLKPGGVVLLAPAWQCRPWTCQGYTVRPYHDLGIWGKFVKASIPIRESIIFRSCYVFPRRLLRTLQWKLASGSVSLRYKKLTPDYEHYWTSDSDAAVSLDPYDAILWFVSRGDECVTYPTWPSQFLVRTNGIVFRKR
jgi:SAM-dependent methyltransferase